MPNDKIDKAVAKGAGLIEGVIYEEIVYEAYGPAGVALMIDTSDGQQEQDRRRAPEHPA